MSNKKVILGVSGGVDSSVAALLLQKQGYEVIGVTMKLWRDEDFVTPNLSDSTDDAKIVCDKLGIEHHVIDMSDDFKKHVVDYFINSYADCKTPNPCVECNRFLKFGKMFEVADQFGAEFISTGHYARVGYDENMSRYVIKKSAAGKKDQTYVLYVIEQSKLSRVLFPLGDFENKDSIRLVAQENGLLTARKRDSQEICFIPNNDTRGFIDKYIQPKQGNIVNANGKILGRHNGIAHYTLGQRKGMGISSPEPIFVTELDKKSNTVFVGSNDDLFTTELYAEKVNWHIIDELNAPLKVKAKIRYSASEAPATVYPEKDGVKVVFDTPQRAVTRGQSVVFYIGDILAGGGEIC